MKIVIGFVLILCGCLLGFYVGFYLMFVGGVMDIVTAIKADVLDARQLGWGIGKCLFAQLVGGVSSLVLCLPGAAILGLGQK